MKERWDVLAWRWSAVSTWPVNGLPDFERTGVTAWRSHNQSLRSGDPVIGRSENRAIGTHTVYPFIHLSMRLKRLPTYPCQSVLLFTHSLRWGLEEYRQLRWLRSDSLFTLLPYK